MISLRDNNYGSFQRDVRGTVLQRMLRDAGSARYCYGRSVATDASGHGIGAGWARYCHGRGVGHFPAAVSLRRRLRRTDYAMIIFGSTRKKIAYREIPIPAGDPLEISREHPTERTGELFCTPSGVLDTTIVPRVNPGVNGSTRRQHTGQVESAQPDDV